MGTAETLEKLSSPPIVEVICGVFFSPLPNFDPVVAGTYWQQRRADFPGHSIHPAAGAPPGLVIGTPPLRTWLISSNDGPFVIQVQADRFYLNWRRRGDAYPRFSTEHGLLERTLREFAMFTDFCQAELGTRPTPTSIELGKIDHLVQGVHWSDKDDLSVLLPSLAPTLSVARATSPEVLLRFREAEDDHSLQVTLASARVESSNLIRLEATVVRRSDSELREAFEAANRQANEVFAALVPAEQRYRFQEGE